MNAKAKEAFEEWHKGKGFIFLVDYYLLTVTEKQGVQMAFLRSKGYEQIHFGKSRKWYIVTNDHKRSKRIEVRGETPEQAWKNLFEEVMKKEFGL